MLPSTYRVECLGSSDTRFQELLQDSREVLLETWRQEEPVVSHWLRDHDDSPCESPLYLWGVSVGAQLVATARITVHQNLRDVPAGYLVTDLERRFPVPIASFNRLAVLPAYQGLGIGRHLDKVRLNRARQLGARSAVAICRENRVSMLRKLGFDVARAGIPGVAMPSIKWTVLRNVLVER